MNVRRILRSPKPLGGVIDAYKCLRCGTSLAVNADSRTFRQPPPLECKRCPGEPDMQARRYYAVGTASSAAGGDEG